MKHQRTDKTVEAENYKNKIKMTIITRVIMMITIIMMMVIIVVVMMMMMMTMIQL